MLAVTTPPTRFIGCDVGKASIVVFDSADDRTQNVPNRIDQLAALAASLDETCLVICEATGGHEDLLLQAMLQADRPAHRADARKVKAFIRSFGIMGKTDAIDARALARYGQERQARLARWQAPDPHRDRLQALVLTRSDLVAQRLACANRLGAPGAEIIQHHLKPLLDCLDTQIEAIDAEVKTVIKDHDTLRQSAKVLATISGVGDKTAAALLALMPELGHINRRQAAALAGLAPHPNQSGRREAYRRTKGGRPEVKRLLFMAALSASRYNPDLKATYQKLTANGKKPMVALVALMRKIIVIGNAKLRDSFKKIQIKPATI